MPSFRVTKIFAPDLDAKGKSKEVVTNTELTEDITAATTFAAESHYQLEEISLGLTVESL